MVEAGLTPFLAFATHFKFLFFSRFSFQVLSPFPFSKKSFTSVSFLSSYNTVKTNTLKQLIIKNKKQKSISLFFLRLCANTENKKWGKN